MMKIRKVSERLGVVFQSSGCSHLHLRSGGVARAEHLGANRTDRLLFDLVRALGRQIYDCFMLVRLIVLHRRANNCVWVSFFPLVNWFRFGND